MKKIHQSLLLLSLFVVILAQKRSISTYTFQEFKNQYRKNYDEGQEDQRYQNFLTNMQYLISRQQSGENIIPNHFLDWSFEELQAINTFYPVPPNYSDYDPERIQQLQSNLKGSSKRVNPSSYDFRSLGKVSGIKNQNKCGAGWAFAVAAHYQSLLLKQNRQYDLSQQYLIQCTPDSNCEGGMPQKGLGLLRYLGMPFQSSLPYKQNDTFYPNQVCQEIDDFIKIEGTIIRIQNRFHAYRNPQQLKEDLILNGPLTVAIHASFEGFFFPLQNGIIDNCPSSYDHQDHVVQLVGYTATHWIIKNSWGQDWGQTGFGYIPIQNDCGLLNNVWLVVVQNDDDTPQPDPSPSPEYFIGVYMLDTQGDGWNNNIFGFSQNDQYVATFGNQFTQGSYLSQLIPIPINVYTHIVVYQIGDKLDQVQFIILLQDGEILFHKLPGQSFQEGTVFKTFCIGVCHNSQNYFLYLIDSWCDGWDGNTIIINQHENQTEFGSEFIDGNKYGPINLQLIQGVQVTITPGVYAQWTDQIGFYIRDQEGFQIFRRNPGIMYSSNEILAQFTPGEVNLLPVSRSLKLAKTQLSREGYTIKNTEKNKGYIIGIIILSILLVGLLSGLTACIIVFRKKRKQINSIYNNHNIQDYQRTQENNVIPSQN